MSKRDPNVVLQEGGPEAVCGAFDRAQEISGPLSQAPDNWPVLDSPACHGIVGEIARLATRNSEADPAAVTATGLAWAGACFGRTRFYRVGDTNHHARLFCVLVGESSRARKGTSLSPVQRIFRQAESVLQERGTLPFPCGLPLNVSHGLSSGEGLVAEIRDKRDAEDENGVEDKRLLIVEGEFGSVLRQFQRHGNTLSPTLRTAWDGWNLGSMTKHNRDKATDPHICIVGHITVQELNALMDNTDIFNGLANRVLWSAVRRSKKLPFARPMPDDDVNYLAKELARVIECAHSQGNAELVMTNSARDHWVNCYEELTRDYPGILGAVTSRAEAQVLRLAMDYALLDGANRIEHHHLEAALTFWRFSFDSAAHIFNGAEVDPVAQRITEALRIGPKTQTDLHDLFDRNLTSKRLNLALNDLQERGEIMLTEEKTAGRSRRIWSLAP